MEGGGLTMSCLVRYSACPSIILRQCLSLPPRTKVDSHAIIQKGQISVIDGRHEKNYWREMKIGFQIQEEPRMRG